MLIYPIGSTAAAGYAAQELNRRGWGLIDHPAPEVTHLLLDVPSFTPDGKLPDGRELAPILQMLPPNLTVIGGNLNHPVLAQRKTLDLLKEERYLAPNAAITAECALQVAAQHRHGVFAGTPILVIGWGRIGKCLARLLKNLDALVTVVARKESDLALLDALGYQSIPISQLCGVLKRFPLIFNTVPCPVLPPDTPFDGRRQVFVELASQPGFSHPDVISARGLPGKYAPEASGKLIAKTILSAEECL